MAYYKNEQDLYSQMSSSITKVDKSQNSLVYNTQAPVALHLSQMLSNLDETLKKAFATSSYASGYDYYLDLRCADVGIFRKEATYAIIKIKVMGKANKLFSKGSIVATTDNRRYTTMEDLTLNDLGEGYVNVKADKSGSVYNVNKNEICYLPIKYDGIVSVNNEDSYYEAYDKETNASLYNRYMVKVKKIAVSGNKADYEQWCKEIDGVGDVQVYPRWDKSNGMDGNGTVKCVIVNANKRKADQDLIDKVKNYIDPTNGGGDGKAPIGATLTVTTVEEVLVNIKARVELISGTTLDEVELYYKNLLENYFENTVYTSKKVSFAKVEGLLLSMDLVADVDDSSVKMNESTSNINLTTEQIAIVGTITLEEM